MGAGPEDSVALAIAIEDVNEAPTVALINPVTALAENGSGATRIKVADIVVSDDALSVSNLALADADAALFEIDQFELFLLAGTALNFEAQDQLNVTVTMDDPALGTAADDSAALVIDVTDVNDAPTGDVTISGTAEQNGTLTAVSTLEDADGRGPLSYQWLRDGDDISGASESSYTTQPLTFSDDDAVFSCLVSNDVGAVVSDNACP